MQLSPEDLRHAQLIWEYMFMSQEPSRADVIIGLGCHDMSVADDVAVLYKRSIASVVVFSGNAGRMTVGKLSGTEAQMMKRRAVALGVPESAILLEEASTNTGQNLVYTQRLLERNGLKPSRVVLVHKPYMLRRDYATFKKQWVGADTVQLMCWAQPIAMKQYLSMEMLDPVETINTMVGDLQRIKNYPKHGYQIEQTIPTNVWRAFEALVMRGYDTQLTKNAIAEA